MKNNVKNSKYYSGVKYSRRDATKATAIILTIVLLLTAILIIWAIATFAGGGEGVFESQSSQLSNLKIENERLRLENEDLKKEIEKYKNGEYLIYTEEEQETEPAPSDDEEPLPDETPVPDSDGEDQPSQEQKY